MDEERSSSSSDTEDFIEEEERRFPSAIDLFLKGAFANGFPSDR